MNIKPRQLQKAMRSMGVQQEELAATEVIIRLADKELVIPEPTVAIVKMMGQETFQISGAVEERPLSAVPEISQDDVDSVVAQTGATPERARDALKLNNGDLAKTILDLNG